MYKPAAHLLSAPHLAPGLDMADEASALLRGQARREIPGVRERQEEADGINITTISVLNSEGESQLGKARGTYITLEIPGLGINKELIDDASAVLARKLKTLLPKQTPAPLLLVGLGNDQATPDSLGPQVVQATLATRHIFKYAPQTAAELARLRSLCTLAPGVLGTTGIETAEIIKGVVERVRPQAIIAIDSLASASLTRVGGTIQLADTGITPGSGVGNQRVPLNRDSLGVPVIAIGVPTVVDTMVILHEAFTQLTQAWEQSGLQHIPPIDQPTIQNISQQLLESFEGNLIVTPKEIDQLIQNISKIIAAAITQAVHSGVNKKNYHLYLN